MICRYCGTTLEFIYFPWGRYVCPVCNIPADIDDVDDQGDDVDDHGDDDDE